MSHVFWIHDRNFYTIYIRFVQACTGSWFFCTGARGGFLSFGRYIARGRRDALGNVLEALSLAGYWLE